MKRCKRSTRRVSVQEYKDLSAAGARYAETAASREAAVDMDGRAYCALQAVKNADEEILELQEQITELEGVLTTQRERETADKRDETGEAERRSGTNEAPENARESPQLRDTEALRSEVSEKQDEIDSLKSSCLLAWERGKVLEAEKTALLSQVEAQQKEMGVQNAVIEEINEKFESL